MKIIEKIKRLPFVTPIFRMLHPTNSTCGCCGLPWASVKHHTIMMAKDRGFFPVCEYCWQTKSKEEIDKAITDLYIWWEHDSIRYDFEVPYTLDEMLYKAHEELKNRKNGKN